MTIDQALGSYQTITLESICSTVTIDVVNGIDGRYLVQERGVTSKPEFYDTLTKCLQRADYIRRASLGVTTR